MSWTNPLEGNEAVSGYRTSMSLAPLAEDIGERLRTHLQSRDGEWCLGVHLRHVFDTDAPSVWVTGNDDRWKVIRRDTVGQGQQTLNHVLDSLLTPTDSSTEHVGAYVGVQFHNHPPLSAECDHDLDLRSDRSGAPTGLDEDGFFDRLDNCESRKAFGVECYLGSATEYSRHEVLRPEQFVCGADKICKALEVPQTALNYESIWCAVAQLSRYSEVYGAYTGTYFLRPRNPYGFVLGLTLITSKDILEACTRDVISELRAAYTALNGAQIHLPWLLSENGNAALSSVIEYRGFRFGPSSLGGDLASEPRLLRVMASALAGEVAEHPLRLFGLRRLEAFNDCETLGAFIRMASQFCDERSEGRQLRFGLLLANPDLLFHWKGPSPIPLADNSGFERLGELAKQHHLIDDPEERALVLPYLPAVEEHYQARVVTGNERLPAFGLELRHFKEAFAEIPRLNFWAEEFRPYVYFTQRHQWCVGCVAGPYSELRVFFRGQLVGFRDGKGWRLAEDWAGARAPWDAILQADGVADYWRGGGAENNGDPGARAVLLETLLRVGFQLSRFVNRKGKGGLLLFSPDSSLLSCENEAGTRDAEGTVVSLSRLRVLEPTKLQHEEGRNWLRGRTLIEGTADYRDETAHRIIRACSQDGAVVVAGNAGEVLEYGVHSQAQERADANGPDENSGGGTKHRAARSFVKALMNQAPGALAVCVSEDGKIEVFFSRAGDQGSRKLDYRTFFGKERYELQA